MPADTDARRPNGELESEVLGILWQAAGPLSPAQVNDALGRRLARTTVTTILARLHEKNVLARTRSGRGFVYAPVQDASAIVAHRMHRELGRGSDRGTVLQRFVSALTPDDEALLRELLDAARPEPDRA